MKTNKRRAVSIVLAFALILSFFTGIRPLKVRAEGTAETTTVKIHYKRTDGDYSKWNLWVWDKANNGDGNAYQFTGKDEDGVFTAITISKTKQVGLIVRTDNWDKDTGDVIIDTSKGDADVFVTSGKPGNATFVQKPLEFKYNTVNLRVHYYRFDQNFKGWDLWVWPQNKDGKAFVFSGKDAYGGALASGTFTGMNGIGKIGIIVRQNEWNGEREPGGDRFIDLAYADKSGNIDVYVLTKEPKLFYTANQVDKSKNITLAKLNTFHEVLFQTNIAVENTSSVKLMVGTKEIASTVKLADDKKSGVIAATDALDMNKSYTVKIDGYTGGNVVLGNIYGSDEFKNMYHYDGELGALYTKVKTTFKVWAPTAQKVELKLYKEGSGDNLKETLPMVKGEKGVWSLEKAGDLAGVYYTYSVTVNGITKETQDIYSKAVGVNGNRTMVVDLSKTNPSGWDKDKGPELKNPTDAIIYEVHIRDITVDPNSGIKMKGKFLGLTETGTKSKEGEATGLDHLKEMGVTHIHLLPSFDFATIDEKNPGSNVFNWGYDPKNYQAPEGSYSTDASKGEVRINEMKQMIEALHNAGIGVIMDSVYNHTYNYTDSPFSKTVPNYYYRFDAAGSIIGTSGCGNDTASERSMFRKYMIDSVAYWAKEYHIDGFRFDLMGIHDITTMNNIRSELDKINPQILMYGEGWNLGGPIPEKERAIKSKANLQKMDTRIAVFSDDMRDGIKGHVFTKTAGGFVNFNSKWKPMKNLKEIVKFGIVASTQNDGVNYSLANYTPGGAWATQPTQTINYASAHDNNTLWDKIAITQPNASESDRIKMDKMANFLVLTSQGIPFLHAGEEMLRTKSNGKGGFVDNSYNSPDSVNKIEWSRKSTYKNVVEYYKGLISLRKAHPAFRMATTAEIQKNLKFIDTNESTIAYTISNNANGDAWKDIAVIANAGKDSVEVTLPAAGWTVVVDGDKAGVNPLAVIEGNKVTVPAGTSMVLADLASFKKDNPGAILPKKGSSNGIGMFAGIAVFIAVAGAACIYIARRRRAV